MSRPHATHKRVLLTLTLILGLTACGGTTNGANNQTPGTNPPPASSNPPGTGNPTNPTNPSEPAPATPTNTFTYKPIRNQIAGINEAQGEVVNGKLYQFGGFDGLLGYCCSPTDRAFVYDPQNDTWTPLATMPVPKDSTSPNGGVTHAGITHDGENIYYAGGYVSKDVGGDKPLQQSFGTRAVWRYNIASNTYTQLANLPEARGAGQLEYLNGQLHFFGGMNSARTRNAGEHYMLDLKGGASSWITMPQAMNDPRHHFGAVTLGGKIYTVGGQHGQDNRVTRATVEAFDPATGTWTILKSLPKALGHIESTFVLGDRIVVAGGDTSPGNDVTDVFAYDPKTDTWTSLTALPERRSGGVAGAIGNGFIYTGGSGRSTGWIAVPDKP